MTGQIQDNARQMRRRILELAFAAGKNGAHVGGALSCVEILAVLYSLLKRDEADLENRDRLILSKGHGALALYCVLEQYGLLTRDETESFESNGTLFYAHAKRDVAKGIEFSGGSLSLGISYAVGVALACRDKKLDNRIYAVLGDGECNEGQVWEAAMSAANFKLDNLTVVVDRNGLQSDGFTRDVMDSTSLVNKFNSFGFSVEEVDGHSIPQLLDSFNVIVEGRPKAIIANTVKGKGVSFMENERGWHHGVLTEKLYEDAIVEIMNK